MAYNEQNGKWTTCGDKDTYEYDIGTDAGSAVIASGFFAKTSVLDRFALDIDATSFTSFRRLLLKKGGEKQGFYTVTFPGGNKATYPTIAKMPDVT